MTVQTRITVLLCTMVILLFGGLLALDSYESHRQSLLIRNNIFEKNTFFDKILRLESASLEMFAYDFSNMDQTVDFVTTPGAPFPAFINSVLESFNVTHVWLYDADFNLMFANTPQSLVVYHGMSSEKAFLDRLLSQRYFRPFFMDTPEGLLEVRSAPVQPSADWERQTRPAGYLLAGRLWDPDYLGNLEEATESTIAVLPIDRSAPDAIHAGFNPGQGLVSFSRVIYGLDNTPLARLQVNSRTPITRELYWASRNQLMFIVISVSLLIGLLSVLLVVWINLPLKKISLSLKTHNPALLEKLQTSPTEFGNLARLILTFFRQQTELTNEIAERQRAEQALIESLEESRRRGAETAALLQASRAVLEHHDFRQSSRSIIDSCTSLSGAENGFIAEITRSGTEPLLRFSDQVTMPLIGTLGEAFTGGKPVYCNDCALPACARLLPAGHTPITNVLCAPLAFEGSIAALLVIANKQDGFTDNDLKMAGVFSEIAAVALLNSRTLESLENSKERFRSVVQTANDAIITVNRHGVIVFWNRGAEDMYGYNQAEAIGMQASMLLPEEFRAGQQRRVAEFLRQDPSAMYRRPAEMVGLRKSGERFPIELSQAMWSTKEGLFFTAIARDITERKSAEEELLRSEKRFRDTVEHSLTGRFIARDGHIVYMNKEQAHLFGDPPEAFNVFECSTVHPEDVARAKEFYRDILTRATPARDANFRLYPFGKMHSPADMRWVTCRGTLIEYDGQESLFVNMMDVTRFMELEQLVRIQDKMASLGRIAAGIAHEIRNPLTGINSYLYSLRACLGRPGSAADHSARGAAIIEQIQSASNKIEGVIRRVMDFSKPGMPKVAPININDPIREALTLSTVTLRKESVALETSLAGALPACRADFHMLEQVMLNLITNAVQAMSASTAAKHIRISTGFDAGRVIATIEDSGPGVTAENNRKIFDPFFTTKSDGSGIGLSLCQRIITDHGGTITVAESCWGGAAFTIELPASSTAAPFSGASGPA
jgi:PAS domain S-box-containing protein